MIGMDYIKLKAKLWQEIKSLEQEYKRNQNSIKNLEERQSDISFEVQNKIDAIEKAAEDNDNFFLHNVSGSLKCKNCDSFDLRIEELTYYCKECHNVYYR